MVSIEHLKNPPLVPYEHLVRMVGNYEETLLYLNDLCDRQRRFINGLGDFIASHEVLDADKRSALLNSIAGFNEVELKLFQERLKNLNK